jgi:hypothetical protein
MRPQLPDLSPLKDLAASNDKLAGAMTTHAGSIDRGAAEVAKLRVTLEIGMGIIAVLLVVHLIARIAWGPAKS